jgi:tetratricopeptide (TPR) repeat protein
MLDTRDLEKRWIKYKIKSYIPHAVILISVVVIISVVFFLINSNVKQTTQQVILKASTDKSISAAVPVAENSIEIKELNTSTEIQKQTQAQTNSLPNKDKQIILSPSMNFMKDMQNLDQPYYETLHPTEVSTKKTASIKKRKKVTQQAPIVEDIINVGVDKNSQHATQVKQKKEDKPVHITIRREETNHDIQEIIKRFKNNHNPALSLFVAKKYYQFGDYAQAYNYALITNGISNDIEDSWLIFAKSLVKLNKKDMAIKTLNEYIKYSHSENAKMLLNNIQSGQFK